MWSRYDAGFMHPRVQKTDKAARFEEMNLPYRYTAYLAAGLPLVVPQEGQRAMRTFVEQQNVGLVYSDYDELAEKLYDDVAMAALSSEAREKRKGFSFDRSADRLVRILEAYAIPR
jgi:glycosyltransferase involved in cell wall biosynthesis